MCTNAHTRAFCARRQARALFDTLLRNRDVATDANRVFCPTPEFQQNDEALYERIASLSFLSFEHLDVSGKSASGLVDKLASPAKELSKINDICTVIGKRECVIKTSHMIW